MYLVKQISDLMTSLEMPIYKGVSENHINIKLIVVLNKNTYIYNKK